MKEALLYERIDGKAVRCFLCRHGCRIKDGKRGICKVRENRGGTLYTLVYDKIVSTNVDPIEKKPFFHFLPGSSSFSIAAMGCNFRCSFC
ncbi:MAG: radical SAM protein, partial [Desulfomonilaceae bacterium]